MAWSIEAIRDELDVWDHREQDIIIKRDKEPSIEAVRKAISELRRGRSSWENSPVGERQANDKAEDAGRRVRQYLVTLKDQLE